MSTAPSQRRRPTRQQSAVIERLGRSEDFTSAQDLHARMREAGDKVGLATVYRTLTALAANGEVDMIRTDEGEAVYRRCSTGHHHHLVCRSCGRTVEIEGPAVERWADRVADEHGYTDVEHTLEIFGTCRECAARTHHS
ncbi:Fur family transcriptional regulator [Ornithinimicrobium tianjinense]|uniref:Transcriptional repressor n=1 Tax=Ornithinimicrobium tianjinense TaxID=1195761 RepID=A0A917BN22_9MICO|nr:Fur family transcriptional regulator [Ornithinimicrobium tianjinense]GGF49372.1 transcriptional repressor [Ornithinimicrobium tianjinense]